MENPRFLKITIIVLLLVNIATLCFMWVSHNRHGGAHLPPPHHGRGGPNAFEFLVHELKLDESQVKQFEEMRNQHHKNVQDVQEKSHDMHHRFFDLLAKNDSTSAVQLADSMAQYQKQIELLTFNHFMKVRAICKPDQQKKFDEVINEALRMMAPPKGPGGPGPHGPQ